jgi:nucleotide-binding universal stress UspA family protein
MKRILVATDGSERARKAIDFACDIASRNNATVYLVHVVLLGYLTSQVGWPYAPGEVGSFMDWMRKEGEGIIDQAEKAIEAKGVKTVQSYLLEGDPASEILQFAKKNDVDMVVVGTHGAGGAETLLLGSVSHKISHLSTCTCVTVK